MLDREEVARRIVAARTVRGIDQLELERLFFERGGDTKKGALGRIERKQQPLTEGGRVVLSRILGVPEDWFTADDPFERFSANGGGVAARMDELASHVSQLGRTVSMLAERAGVAEVAEVAAELRSIGVQGRHGADEKPARAASRSRKP